VQQAQVVLAAQDMVDEVQKMSEQVSAMQFKDLPALVDQIKNEVGVQQSASFNTDSAAALGGLVQNLQASKAQLEQALGVVTGESAAMQLPGAEPAAAVPPVPGQEEMDIDTDTETDIEVDDGQDSNALATSLGRDRR
jgi:hypothetical protein